jgi:recombination protein RecA
MPLTEETQKSLEILQTVLNKKYGDGTISFLSGQEVSSIPRFSSGIPSVDWATGGGYPRGRMLEILGPESSGKTTLTLHAIAEAQRNGHVCAFIDAEHALDLNYARALGVNVDELIINQPDTAEEALDIVEELSNSGLVQFIVIDSVAALVPKAELDGEMGGQLPGLMARLMSQACRKLTGTIMRNGVTLFWINQIRYKIGVMFGSPETTSGGNALKFYASVRIDIRKRGQIKDGETVIANDTEVRVIKNKTAPPYRVAEFEIEFGKGVNKTLDLVRIAVQQGIIQKSGAWYSFNHDRIGQGEKNVVLFLNEHPDILELITQHLQQLKISDTVI